MTMTISGNGTITGSTAPAFSAKSGAVSIPTTNTFTKITLNNETFDPTGAFDSTTNYRFQPTVAGYYQITGYGNGLTSGSTANNLTEVQIFKNGSAYSAGSYTYPIAAQYATSTTSDLVYLNGSTDYVELWGRVVFATGTATITGGMSGYLARSA